MRKFITSIGVAVLFLAAIVTRHDVRAANFQLTWTDTNPPVYQVTGYNLYMAVNTNPPAQVASISTNPPLSVIVTNLLPNLYKFYATATNVWGESTPSMSVQTPPGLPSGQGIQLWINLH